MFDEMIKALFETLIMVLASGSIAALLGGLLGVILYATAPKSFFASPFTYRILGVITNATRSIPYIILMIAIIPFTRWVTGTSIGTLAACVPLSLAAIPFVARLIESALNEVPRGLIEAAEAMGASPAQIMWRVLLPEAFASIISGLTLTFVTLVGYSAMAGAMGGGGLGYLAVNYGYQRFEPKVMLVTVVILIVLVQAIQMTGDRLVQKRLGRKV